ncbi:Bifunctional protein PaaZ [Pigmentiphaga humi]|uniref:Bifunctional protein PaaZ n=1 Tax=Pigmentiphaga humi TaxID=2478468 RepID=A0A3P4B5X9_9BURK|nr:MaoC family dehydratase [Pigmentiphaga humi]VCU71030.1 Bifunctional protein PaaZ [Pigmentiphaga humi]
MTSAATHSPAANGGEARCFEDFQVGERWTSAPTVVTEEEIVAFARANDPQPMHLDPEAARAGPFGMLIASGWQIAALSMRVFLQAGGYGKTPMVGMGVDELRWTKPVKAGDTLVVEREVIETVRSKSRPGVGMIRTRVTVRNQHGDAVMSLVSLGRVPARAQA